MTSLQGGYDRYQRVDGFFAVNGGDGDEVSVVKENNHGKISCIIYKSFINKAKYITHVVISH